MILAPEHAWLDAMAFNDYSQYGEDGVLEAIFNVIRPSNKWCLEVGATDGIFFSNTRRLLEQGWSAILIEADRIAHARLLANSEPFGGRATCVNALINDTCRLEGRPRDADLGILAHFGVPLDFDLAVIDIDGQDYHAFNSLLRYQPRVVLIEFDHNADPDFIPMLGGPGQAGERAIARLGAGKFYTAVYRNFCNLILVRQPLERLLVGALPGQKGPAS